MTTCQLCLSTIRKLTSFVIKLFQDLADDLTDGLETAHIRFGLVKVTLERTNVHSD